MPYLNLTDLLDMDGFTYSANDRAYLLLREEFQFDRRFWGMLNGTSPEALAPTAFYRDIFNELILMGE